MCRLFGCISVDDVEAERLLLTAPHALWRQSQVDRKRKQGDGWGVGWFEGTRPRIAKSERPMYRERAAVAKAARKASGKTLLGHVRWASNPLKLKKSELIGLPHTQPFTHGKWIFAHNGTLFIPKEVAAKLGTWKKYLKGKNDSEVLFYWLLKHLASPLGPKDPCQAPNQRPMSGTGSRMADAVRRAIQGLHRIWKSCRKSYPLHAFPYHGLNWVLSDGKTMLAFCYADPRGFGKSKALGNRRQSYYQLQSRITDRSITIASEPLDGEQGWEGFRSGELLMVERQGQRLAAQRSQVL